MITIAAIVAIGISGCASVPYVEPLDWSSLSDGCYDRGLSEVLLSPGDYATILHLTDIRIGRLPDTGNGPGLVVHFRRGLDSFGQYKTQPEVFLAVGDWKRSCSILLEVSACPQSSGIYNTLAAQSIPIGHAFDDPIGFTVMHGTMYFLSSKDGNANQLDWSYVGDEHPLQDQIDTALDSLSQCAEPAATAFSRYAR